jgi:nitroimidazol reductase NimA-like FMN-containing flavoprotein (pyridoxamine 5'-phosphate oxidase superfamily)
MHTRMETALEMTTSTLLDERMPLRISVQTAKGPLIAPLWFDWDGARFWCASQKDAVVVRALEREPLCAFDLSTNEMPYRGLRGRGHARCLPERGIVVLERLIDRYLPNRRTPLAAWLLSRSANEVAIEITPTWQTTWDYSARMSDRG